MPVAPAADIPNWARHILVLPSFSMLTTNFFIQISTLYREKAIYANLNKHHAEEVYVSVEVYLHAFCFIIPVVNGQFQCPTTLPSCNTEWKTR
jgi:hypothetical protein